MIDALYDTESGTGRLLARTPDTGCRAATHDHHNRSRLEHPGHPDQHQQPGERDHNVP